MKAIILAAGRGERLKEITNCIPKPMIEFRGKPVLQYNIELCKRYGIREIYINLHHLPSKITDYFGEGEKFGVKIKYSHEKKLLGTAGAVGKFGRELWDISDVKTIRASELSNSNKATKQKDLFYVIYGDQISNFNLDLLKEKFQKHYTSDKKTVGVIAFHYREDVIHSGVAEFNDAKKIIRFIEKPKSYETDSHWVNAGVYCFHQDIFDFIPDKISDFGRDIFPHILKKNFSLYGVCEHKDVNVFDTPEMYKKSFDLSGEIYE